MKKDIGQKFILTNHPPYGLFGENTKYFPKFIEVEIIEQITNLKPIILLDDVFSELDEFRQKLLINNRDSQIIITTTSINKKIMEDIDYKEVNLHYRPVTK